MNPYQQNLTEIFCDRVDDVGWPWIFKALAVGFVMFGGLGVLLLF